MHDKLTTIINDVFPVKINKPDYKNKIPWLTGGQKKSIKTKHKLYVFYLKHLTKQNHEKYKKFRNTLKVAHKEFVRKNAFKVLEK